MKKPSQSTKRGPVEVVESNGVKIPIYRANAFGKSGYMLAYYADGKRIRERASTIEEARKTAKAKIKTLTSGAAHVGTLTPRQTAVVADAVEVLKGVGVPLSTVAREYAEAQKILDGRGSIVIAVQHYVDFLANQKGERNVPFPRVVSEFLEEIESLGRSARYIEDCSSRLSRPRKAFKTPVESIKAADISAWLTSIKVKGRTRNNYCAMLRTVFAFAKDKGYLPEGARTEAEKVKTATEPGGEIGIYTPQQFRTLLEATSPEFLPLVAIGGFAGLRTAEIHRLDWKDVNLSTGHIIIGARIAKTAARRIVPIVPALKEWLANIAKSSGPVVPQYSHDSVLLRASKAAMTNPDLLFVRNGLRHSFVSYRVAAVQNVAQVAMEAGNSPRIITENYRALVAPAQAEEWFSIRPLSA
jgi:integrase